MNTCVHAYAKSANDDKRLRNIVHAHAHTDILSLSI